jgi:hypothetical protein
MKKRKHIEGACGGIAVMQLAGPMHEASKRAKKAEKALATATKEHNEVKAALRLDMNRVINSMQNDLQTMLSAQEALSEMRLDDAIGDIDAMMLRNKSMEARLGGMRVLLKRHRERMAP